ncbi:hypothetical protein [Chitinilyticum piscinae]|uniref:Uncharacterized protein n=1 Tax=Chitinilyticum piscinae TaxID=2866724 RepID=A0A8J7KBK5_9NEIS|nr:hypothetical protein [Chitinilyticum piscinae]MBE9610324.1 hypothetical protein [Chitinilyticum piscinae]
MDEAKDFKGYLTYTGMGIFVVVAYFTFIGVYLLRKVLPLPTMMAPYC